MKRFLPVLVLLALASCEEKVTNADWPPYSEKLVLNGSMWFLTPDSVSVRCRVNRTVSMTESVYDSQTFIDDAQVMLVGDADTVPVPRRGLGRYQIDGRIPGSGRWTLLVRRGSQVATSTLTMPGFTFAPDTAYLEGGKPWTDSTRCVFRFTPMALPRAAYECWVNWFDSLGRSLTLDTYSWDDSRPNTSIIHRLPDGRIEVRGYTSELIRFSRYCRVSLHVISAAYRDGMFHQSTVHGIDITRTTAENPPFNVFGDGIGFFYYIVPGPWVDVK